MKDSTKSTIVNDIKQLNSYTIESILDVFNTTERKLTEDELAFYAELYKELESRKEQTRFGHGGNIAEQNKEMLNNQAREVDHHIDELNNVLKSKVDVEPWVVAKMERATTDLSDITHYLEGEQHKEYSKPVYAEGGNIKIGETIRLKNDLPYLASLDSLKGKDLKVKDIKNIYFASGSKSFYIINHDGDEHEINEDFIEHKNKMSTGGVIGKDITFNKWDETRQGTILELTDDGDYVVSSGAGSTLVSPDDVISFNEPKAKAKRFGFFEDGGGVGDDFVIFSIDDDSLDTLLNDHHSSELDYEDVDGDSYYKLNKRDFDRFIDAADSKGFDVDYENSEDAVVYVLNERMATGGGVRKAPFKLGDMVYSYQNPNNKMRISFIVDNGIIDGVDYGWNIKVALKTDSNGKYDPKGTYSKSSKWMSQNSVSKTKKEKYIAGGGVGHEKKPKLLVDLYNKLSKAKNLVSLNWGYDEDEGHHLIYKSGLESESDYHKGELEEYYFYINDNNKIEGVYALSGNSGELESVEEALYISRANEDIKKYKVVAVSKITAKDKKEIPAYKTLEIRKKLWKLTPERYKSEKETLDKSLGNDYILKKLLYIKERGNNIIVSEFKDGYVNLMSVGGNDSFLNAAYEFNLKHGPAPKGSMIISTSTARSYTDNKPETKYKFEDLIQLASYQNNKMVRGGGVDDCTASYEMFVEFVKSSNNEYLQDANIVPYLEMNGVVVSYKQGSKKVAVIVYNPRKEKLSTASVISNVMTMFPKEVQANIGNFSSKYNLKNKNLCLATLIKILNHNGGLVEEFEEFEHGGGINEIEPMGWKHKAKK